MNNNLDNYINYFNSLPSRPVERCKRITDKLLQLWLLTNYDLRFNQFIDYVLKDSTVDRFNLEDTVFEELLDKLLEQYK